jgi:small subunit ribosomal protein S16
LAVKIRLKRMGSKKKPFYRIIATDSRMPRDGRFIETLGYYNPMTEPADIKIKEDLIFKWMQRGAVPTTITEQILRSTGVMKKWSLLKRGVSPEELDAKYEELKAGETQPMDPAARAEKKAAKKAAVEAETASETEAPAAEAPAAEAPVAKAPAAEPEAEKPAEAEAEKPAEAEAEKPAEVEAEKPAEAEAEKPAEGDDKTEKTS